MRQLKIINKKTNVKIINWFLLSIIFGILLLSLFISGCTSKKELDSQEVINFCNDNNITSSCGVERCILQYSSQFSDNIKLQNERNYYICKLIERGDLL